MAMSIDAQEIAHKLGGASKTGNGWRARCPAHDDQKPSLVIYDRPEGGVIVKCMASCEQSAVINALKARKLWPQSGVRKSPAKEAERRARKQLETVTSIVSPIPADLEQSLPEFPLLNGEPPTAIYPYRSARAELLSYVLRWDRLDRKQIRPASLGKQTGGGYTWVFKAPSDFTLYGLEYLADRTDAEVLIVEGEKTANVARKLLPDHAVLSWRGGASAVGKNDFGPLAGRRVTIVPDADDPGISAGKIAAEKARAAGATAVALVHPPSDFPEGWDLADPLPAGWTVQSLLANMSDTFEAASDGSANDAPRPLIDFVLTAPELAAMDIPPREYIIEPFLATQSMNMMYAKRGLGKTWTAMTLALCVAEGEDFLGFCVGRERRVLYLDGEMPTADLQRRLLALSRSLPENLLIVPSELLFREDRPLNVQENEDRARVEQLLEDLDRTDRRPDLIILDNLSSLSGGIDENDNSALDKFLQWLVGLRHSGYAILLIHHAGKSGSQRGASRREDLLDTSIELKDPPKKDEDGEDVPRHPGAHFIMGFPKTRDRRPEPDELVLKLIDDGRQLVWSIDEVVEISRALRLLKAIWLTKPQSQKDLAVAEKLTEGRISQLCTELRQKGQLQPNNPLVLTGDGKEAVLAVYPELERQMLQQGELAFRDAF